MIRLTFSRRDSHTFKLIHQLSITPLYKTPATTTTQKYLLWVYQKYPPLEEEKYPPCCTVVLFQGQEKCTVTNPGKEAG